MRPTYIQGGEHWVRCGFSATITMGPKLQI